jgi:hypothetical protein
MPQAIPIIIGLITAGTSIASTVHSFTAGGGGGGSAPPDPAKITQDAINSESAKRGMATKEAAQFLPGIEANSPGVSPDYLKDVSATFSGNANLAQSPEMQQLVARFLGLDQGASFGGSSSFGSGSGSSSPFNPGLTAG